MVKLSKKRKVNLYKDNRTIIRKIFYDVQCRLNRKNLYSEASTATEVISKIEDNFHYNNTSISEVYNKAKFSNLLITDEDVDVAKEQHSKVKLKIK